MKRLKNQVAIVTGSSSGIGQAIAIALAKDGADVCINYNSSKEGADETLHAVQEVGGEGIIVQADIRQPDQVESMFEKTLAKWDTIDILVCNAGLQKDSPFLEMTLKDWETVIETDLTGQFLCTQQAAKEFTRRGIVKERSKAAGKIICISSVHDVVPWAGHLNYATAKGGVQMFMKTLAQELGKSRIRVNGIAPGAIKTSINQDVWEDEQSKEKLLELIPYGRLGTTEDVSEAAVWLASDQSDYIHGHMLYIDGGMTLYPGFIGNG